MPTNRENKGKGTKGSNYDLGDQQNSDLASGPGDNAQRGGMGSQQSGNIGQGNQSQSDLGSGPGDNSRLRQGGNQQSQRNQQSDSQRGNLQSGGQGSRSGRSQLDQDDLDSDDNLQR